MGMMNLALLALGVAAGCSAMGSPPENVPKLVVKPTDVIKENSFIRGVLLAGKFRTLPAIRSMSTDDERNTLIVELTQHSNQSVGHYQAMDDATLSGAGAVLAFMREAQIRDDDALATMSDDDQRNTLIVEIAALTGFSGPYLQGLSNIDLVRTALSDDYWYAKSNSFIRGVLLSGKFRTLSEIRSMTHDDQRNTLIVELTNRSNQPVEHYQGMDDATLSGAGAVLVVMREAQIRDDDTLMTMSDDDQRNTLIVEIGALGFPGEYLQGLSNLDLVRTVLSDDWFEILK
jgi:hypothetical protein